jgi:hypothetical protein
MIGSLRKNWKHTWKAVWSRLDESTKSPDDLFARLYRVARLYLAVPLELQQEIGILNDRQTAKAFFRQLTCDSFKGEQAIIAFLEEIYKDLDLLADGCALFYKRKVSDFLETYNLPYRISDNFEIRLMLVGPLAALYRELRLLNEKNPHLAGLMDDFEHLFHRYCQDRHDTDLRLCIESFVKYQEALVRDTLARPASTASFSRLVGQLDSWPHLAVKSAVCNLYGFCSNYPGMRHGGNPTGQLRILRELDAVALGAFFLGFCGYLTEDIRVKELIES